MSNRLLKILFMSLCALVLHPSSVFAGITITKAVIIDKDQGTEVSSGYADADLSVYFEGDANCTCCAPDLRYKWYFGDGSSASGKNVSHNYAGGTFYPYLCVRCYNCGGHKHKSGLTVYVISGIEVTKIGGESPPTNKRLCFNSKVDCAAHALPASLPVGADNKIDWRLQVGTYHIDKANDKDPDMTLPVGNWPSYNSSWGSGTLYISIDGPHVPGQQDELITGAASFEYNNQTVKKFFDGGDADSQNPSSHPNWFHYWKDTSANYGTLNWHTGYPTIKYEGGEWRPYLGPLDNDPYTPPEGDNGGNELLYIDAFGWMARHEGRHVTTSSSWWPNGYTGIGDNDEGTGDWMPDSQEPTLGGTPENPINGGPFDINKINTDGDVNWRDDEDYTCYTQASWTEGSADDEDWAHPGKQWQ